MRGVGHDAMYHMSNYGMPNPSKPPLHTVAFSCAPTLHSWPASRFPSACSNLTTVPQNSVRRGKIPSTFGVTTVCWTKPCTSGTVTRHIIRVVVATCSDNHRFRFPWSAGQGPFPSSNAKTGILHFPQSPAGLGNGGKGFNDCKPLPTAQLGGPFLPW